MHESGEDQQNGEQMAQSKVRVSFAIVDSFSKHTESTSKSPESDPASRTARDFHRCRIYSGAVGRTYDVVTFLNESRGFDYFAGSLGGSGLAGGLANLASSTGMFCFNSFT